MTSLLKKMMLRSRLSALLLSICSVVLAAELALAQSYPTKPVRIITVQPGGPNDLEARFIAQGITEALGQPLIVENRSSSLQAGEAVAKAPPDGYTLLLGGTPIYTEQLFHPISYDPVKNLAPITIVVRKSPYILVVHPSLRVNSVRELIALAKAHPGALNYARVGVGGGPHMAGELFKSLAGVDIVSVGYKGVAAAVTSIAAGETQIMFADVAASAPHVKTGRLRGLAVTSAQPSAFAPGIPTIAASGLPGYYIGGIDAMWAPAGTPAAIISRLNSEIARFLATAKAKEDFFNISAEAVGSSPEELAATIKTDMAQTAKLIKDAGIRAD